MGERVATKLTEYPVFSDAVGALIDSDPVDPNLKPT
jgi:hypothetical protein